MIRFAKGSPIRVLRQEAKRCRSQLFLSRQVPFCPSFTLELNSNPSFLLLIPDLASHGGDPFSHPSGSSAQELHLKSLRSGHPIPSPRDPENVQCRARVHSVAKEFWFAPGPFAARASNPLLTHGSVESLSKAFSDHSVGSGAESGRLQSVPRALFTNPSRWLAAALLKSFIACWPVPGTSAFDRSGCPAP